MKHIWTIVDAKPSKKVIQIKENASPVTESIINRVPINAQMWKMKKKWKGCTVFANVCPSNEGKKFQLVRRLGVAGPTQKSLWSSSHFLWPAILSQSKACLLKRVYSIYLILKRGNLKVIQIWGMIPEVRNTNFTLNGPKKKNKQSWKFVLMHMAVNLNHCKVLCMEQIISSAQVWHDISLVMTTS